MITFGLCLIYYGSALWLYQVYGWLIDGQWTPYPVLTAWRIVFAPPSFDWRIGESVVHWVLNWPLSLTLLLSGLAILASVIGVRRVRVVRKRRLRLRWIVEQCHEIGYYPWNIPKLLAELERDNTRAKTGRKKRLG